MNVFRLISFSLALSHAAGLQPSMSGSHALNVNVVDLTTSECERKEALETSAAAADRIGASSSQVFQRWRPRVVRLIQEYTGEIRVAYTTKATRQALYDVMPTVWTVWSIMSQNFDFTKYRVDPFTRTIEEGKMEEYSRDVLPLIKMCDFAEAAVDYAWAFATTVKKFYVLVMNCTERLAAYDTLVREHSVRRTKAMQTLASLKLVMDMHKAPQPNQERDQSRRRSVEDVWSLVKHKVKVVSKHSRDADSLALHYDAPSIMKNIVDTAIVSHLRQWLNDVYTAFIRHEHDHWQQNVSCAITTRACPIQSQPVSTRTMKVCMTGKRFAILANTITKETVYNPDFCAAAFCFPLCAHQYRRQLSTLSEDVIDYSVTPNVRDEVPTRIYDMICSGLLKRVLVPSHKVRDCIQELTKGVEARKLRVQRLHGNTNLVMIANEMAKESRLLASWAAILSTTAQYAQNCQKLLDDQIRRKARDTNADGERKTRKRARNDVTAAEHIHGTRDPREDDITDMLEHQ